MCKVFCCLSQRCVCGVTAIVMLAVGDAYTLHWLLLRHEGSSTYKPRADANHAAGDFEGSSLVRAVNKKVKTQHGRPLTYDFLKNSVEELGFKARLAPLCRVTASLAPPASYLLAAGCAASVGFEAISVQLYRPKRRCGKHPSEQALMLRKCILLSRRICCVDAHHRRLMSFLEAVTALTCVVGSRLVTRTEAAQRHHAAFANPAPALWCAWSWRFWLWPPAPQCAISAFVAVHEAPAARCAGGGGPGHGVHQQHVPFAGAVRVAGAGLAAGRRRLAPQRRHKPGSPLRRPRVRAQKGAPPDLGTQGLV